MKSSISILAGVAFMFFLLGSAVMAQPIDYCEGNFDNDQDQDGTDAFVFKQDYGRSSLKNPCPVIACQTAEQLEIRIVQLETQLAQVTALLANVTRGTVQGQDTIRFSGMNVQIVDGSGTTDGTANGRGNLIVGYNEFRNLDDDRTGSHNIVVGLGHNYSSYGGLVAGFWNTISGACASVCGGALNTASGQTASVSGGASNDASNNGSSVCGGFGNTASGQSASVSGGSDNTSSGISASVSGGRYNVASGDYAFVGGGGYDTSGSGNKAFAHYSAILGGAYNIAGDEDLIDHTIGQNSSVSGGDGNSASGIFATVSGGALNQASGGGASVSGGYSNQASVLWSSVSGGFDNIASGDYSSVSGGSNRSATGGYDWAAGSLLENQ